MPALTGGTQAPAVGLGQAAPPRRARYRTKVPRGRQQRLVNRVAAARARRARDGGTEAPAGPQVAQRHAQSRISARPAAAVSAGVQPGIGRQLSRLVSSGAIDQPRAEHTAKERQLLEWAYGKDWRTQIGGGRGNVRLAREALAREPDNPMVRANYEALMTRRRKLLEHARGMRGVTQTSPAE